MLFCLCCSVDWIAAILPAAFCWRFAVFCLCWLFLSTVDDGNLKAGECVTSNAKAVYNWLSQWHNHCFCNFLASRRCLRRVFPAFSPKGYKMFFATTTGRLCPFRLKSERRKSVNLARAVRISGDGGQEEAFGEKRKISLHTSWLRG